ncbi:MAG: glycosyltransferase family 2 protein [Minisyncoccia bacterium]
MNKSNISFIIPAYNCDDTIEESVDSIFNGNFEDGDEVIIVDDASTDDTSKIITRLKKKYSQVISFRHQINKGTAAAGRNTAIQISKNDLLFTLDSDNILISGSIKKLKEYLLLNNADAVAFSELWFFKNDINNITQKWLFQKEITAQNCLAGHITPCPTGNYLFTKSSWKKAGTYFEPTIVNQTLDSWTFGIRQLFSGSKMITLENTYYLHRAGINSHWVRENKKGNVTMSALIAVMPFLDKIIDEDIDYMLSKEGRFTWFDNLKTKPIRLRGEKISENTSRIIKLEKNSKIVYKIKAFLRKLIK